MKRFKNLIPRFRPNWFRRGILLITLVTCAGGTQVFSGVLIAPTMVVLTEANRTGRLILRNPTDKPQEVSISLAFGYPESDSVGYISISLVDSNVTDPHSAADWVRAFPRQFVLAPGAEQIVRFIASPPKGLADGEYWARIMVRSEESKPHSVNIADGQIGAWLNMVIQTAISLKYRRGELVSRVEVPYSEANLVDTTVVAMIDMVNRGNVSYLGKLKCRLLDADKREVTTFETNIAVYYNLRRRIELPVTSTEFKPPFQVETIISTRGRTDIALTDVVPGNEVAFTLPVE